MKALHRRLNRLANQFGLEAETEYDRWLRGRLESAKQRIAEARNRGELPPAEERPLTEFDQRLLVRLKHAAWHAKLRADRRAKR